MDPVFRVNFKPLVSARRREFLMHWDYGLINSVTSDTTGGLISVNNSGLASLLTVINPTELDQPLLTLAEEDVGLYARSLWSDNLGTVTSQTTDPVQLPSCVASTTPHQSVIKFLYDVFSVKASSELVYRNDLNVIIDVIIRQLNNIRLPESEVCILCHRFSSLRSSSIPYLLRPMRFVLCNSLIYGSEFGGQSITLTAA